MRPRLWFAAALLFLLKATIMTLFRGVVPFAPYFAQALGVSESRFFTILSFAELIGAVGPVFGKRTFLRM